MVLTSAVDGYVLSLQKRLLTDVMAEGSVASNIDLGDVHTVLSIGGNSHLSGNANSSFHDHHSTHQHDNNNDIPSTSAQQLNNSVHSAVSNTSNISSHLHSSSALSLTNIPYSEFDTSYHLSQKFFAEFADYSFASSAPPEQQPNKE